MLEILFARVICSNEALECGAMQLCTNLCVPDFLPILLQVELKGNKALEIKEEFLALDMLSTLHQFTILSSRFAGE